MLAARLLADREELVWQVSLPKLKITGTTSRQARINLPSNMHFGTVWHLRHIRTEKEKTKTKEILFARFSSLAVQTGWLWGNHAIFTRR